MKFAYKFSNLLGSVYRKGNLIFSHDGNTVLSPVGNRITLFDLKNNKSETLNIESRYNFTTIALSPNGYLLIAVNEVGELCLFILISRTVLHRKLYKKPIRDVKFSPNGRYFALTKDNKVFIYRAPGRQTREYNPFGMEKVLHASYDEVSCLEWSSDSRIVVVGGKDMCTRLYAIEKLKNIGIYTLSGHSDRIVGCYFEDKSLDLYTVSRNGHLCVWDASLEIKDLVSEGSTKWHIASDDDDGKKANDTESMDVVQVDNSLEDDLKLKYKRAARHFLKDSVKASGLVVLTSAAFNKKNHLLVTGFSNGAFLLHEMPDCNLIHSLKIENDGISSLAFNSSGDWIALGASKEGQLVVWEWQSESFVLKQQGHFNNLNCLAYSPDGQFIATGGVDGKVKVWDSGSGFCFVTFNDHKGGISGLVFTQSGKALISASLDGTVRAFDLQRYRNFRTFTSPRPTQFSCIAVDNSGEIVCAGSQDSFEIYVWSLKTGRLLEILSGHEAPVGGVSFCPNKAILASVSWDKTLRIWDIFESKGSRETITLIAEGLTCEFRPDGFEIAVATLDGQILFFDPDNAVQIGSIEGRNDLGSGRSDTDLVTAKKLLGAQAFSTLCYTADGECVLAAGKSKNVCIYHVRQMILLKKFEITCNHSLDAVDDFINRRKMTDFGNIALIDSRDPDYETSVDISLPGVKVGDKSSRAFKPEVRVSCVRFSPTGRSFSASTTEGLLIYSLDNNLVFDPFDLDMEVTPESIRQNMKDEKFSDAILMAFRLNEEPLIKEVFENIPFNQVPVIAQFLPQLYVEKALSFLGAEIEKNRYLEFYVTWIQNLLVCHGMQLKNRSSSIMGILRTLQKNLTIKHEDLEKICDHNKYAIQYVLSVGEIKQKREEEAELKEIEPLLMTVDD